MGLSEREFATMCYVRPKYNISFESIPEADETLSPSTEEETISVDEKSGSIARQTTSIDEVSPIEHTTSVVIESNLAVSTGEMSVTVEQDAAEHITNDMHDMVAPVNEEVTITIEEPKDEKVPNDMAAPANELTIAIDNMAPATNEAVIITVEEDIKDEKVHTDMADPVNEFIIAIDNMVGPTNQEVIITIDNTTVPEEAHCRMPISSEQDAPKSETQLPSHDHGDSKLTRTANPFIPLNIDLIKEKQKAAKKGKLFWSLVAVFLMIVFFMALTVLKIH
ncbi:uncharacterized protein BO80DRAFT_482523 [Aspergillus ibericus CBS 121593]|uniref:Uncharacterized protein n=1 Tax=Aspergillus ibericus CBS 121593 TaxID=1448316 RepID=A0A395GP32_9EURO|nr:hypothetical protein BO80DRAFT_482523 [Aspergillus ibericus CBS 121593]RAK97255.1 hypothetical protein BO80DRAFT_482523 [Aspergillus ibericus CBS 121593]